MVGPVSGMLVIAILAALPSMRPAACGKVCVQEGLGHWTVGAHRAFQLGT
jgi:hypothetical protein